MFYCYVKISLYSTQMTQNIAKLVNQEGVGGLKQLTKSFPNKRGKNSSL